MGLFSRHKKTEEDSTSQSSDKNSEKNGAPQAPNPQDLASSIPPMSSLSSPPVPKASNPLEDIKSEVTSETPAQEDTSASNQEPNNENAPLQREEKNEEDSLFDFSSSDLFGEEHSSSSNQIVPQQESINSNTSKNSEDPFDLGGEFESEPTDTHMEKTRSLSFEQNNSGYGSRKDENFFMTTMQFKAMVELVDQVKIRVKDSSERHMKLLEIKSEEDLEYENLRRDFQFVEDKLYELDSIIFNK